MTLGDPPNCGSVEYGGSGQPDVLLATDLPLHGAAVQVVGAVRLVLAQHGWRAANFRVRHVSCDHYLAAEDRWSIDQALSNAAFICQQARVVGMIGPFNSAVTASVLPMLNRAGLAVVSASNTYAPLTVHAPSFEPDEPDRYAPLGEPSFVRLFPSDLHQSLHSSNCCSSRAAVHPSFCTMSIPTGGPLPRASSEPPGPRNSPCSVSPLGITIRPALHG